MVAGLHHCKTDIYGVPTLLIKVHVDHDEELNA